MEIKYNRSLSGVPENQQQQPLRRITKTYIENRDPVRRNLTMLYNEDTQQINKSMLSSNNDLRRKMLNQERVKRSLNQDVLEDKENVPQHKGLTTKLYTLPQELQNISIKPKFDHTIQENKNLQKCYTDEIFFYLKEQEKKSTPQEFLKNHSIPSNLRAKMIDWMVEVLCSYKCTDQTFFVAVRTLDFYFAKSEKQLEVSDLHLCGVTSMFIAAKYEEIHPMKLSVVYEKIAHKKLTTDQIKKKESDILQTIGFDLVGGTLFDLYNLILTNCFIESKLLEKNYKYLKKLCLYLSKMVLFDYEICGKNNYTLLAAALIFVAFKIVEQLETTFNADSQIKDVAQIIQVDQDQLVEVAAKILNLAKNFEKHFPNLENLKKFNGFQCRRWDEQ
ncbi:unnamed protein product (macronuclear) [Paramecium tetraurelia]|uniref:Cyclin-like domain-containing protein n=1 Tax=Paramecium tetraurelia TaxID=5888 RepID=A0CWM9_PARTE|nr:uncharacterized protein GSPATT00001399001 [Paramecium tetraurelia]CAK75196.1 unnamed protein product [Paramecium tetraurelia]|eukprot:XP_001442593.1 hypothetical protein (macronuclear) [Paramecium tetraurelia strain d4-2]